MTHRMNGRPTLSIYETDRGEDKTQGGLEAFGAHHLKIQSKPARDEMAQQGAESIGHDIRGAGEAVRGNELDCFDRRREERRACCDGKRRTSVLEKAKRQVKEDVDDDVDGLVSPVDGSLAERPKKGRDTGQEDDRSKRDTK